MSNRLSDSEIRMPIHRRRPKVLPVLNRCHRSTTKNTAYQCPSVRSVGGIIPAECRLILLCVIRLDGLGLDDDGGIAAGEGAAFGGDGAGDIARGESQCHGDGGSDGDDEVLNGLPQALFLYIG